MSKQNPIPDLSASEISHLIDEWILNERDRKILKRRMIDGIIDFDETRVHEIMVPRMDMLTMEASDTLDEAVIQLLLLDT